MCSRGSDRAAADHLAGVLERWPRLTEAERQAVFDSHTGERRRREARAERERRRAARVPALRAGSAELFEHLAAPAEGATVRGHCPACRASDVDLRVFAQQRFMLCYPCYFTAW